MQEEIKSDEQENPVPDEKNEAQDKGEELNEPQQDKIAGGHLYY